MELSLTDAFTRRLSRQRLGGFSPVRWDSSGRRTPVDLWRLSIHCRSMGERSAARPGRHGIRRGQGVIQRRSRGHSAETVSLFLLVCWVRWFGAAPVGMSGNIEEMGFRLLIHKHHWIRSAVSGLNYFCHRSLFNNHVHLCSNFDVRNYSGSHARLFSGCI